MLSYVLNLFAEVDNLTDRLQRNSMQIVYDYDNGDQEYGQFVDAD